MSRPPLRAGLFALLLTVLPLPALATGTPVGTSIANVATVSYRLNGQQGTTPSNPVVITVDEKLDLALTWEDTTCLTVEPGTRQAMLTYRLTNTGNGDEAFRLAVSNNLPADQFDPQHPGIILDSNGNGGFDSGDRSYDPGNPPRLAADASLVIFVFNDIPAPLDGGDRGNSRLIATAATGSGAPGTPFPPRNEGERGAVTGPSGGQATADGCYLIETTGLELRKSAEVRDRDGGTQPRSGSVITYRIDVTVGGTNRTSGVLVTDAVPAHTVYLPGSLRLLSAGGPIPLSDAMDSDRGQIVEDSSQTIVQFPLGDLEPGIYTVTFQVTIL